LTQLERKKNPTDQTGSELEQQRNVLVFLSPSLEVEVLGYVEIPSCIAMGLRKWFLTAAGLGAVGSHLGWVLWDHIWAGCCWSRPHSASSTALHPVPAERVQR